MLQLGDTLHVDLHVAVQSWCNTHVNVQCVNQICSTEKVCLLEEDHSLCTNLSLYFTSAFHQVKQLPGSSLTLSQQELSRLQHGLICYLLRSLQFGMHAHEYFASPMMCPPKKGAKETTSSLNSTGLPSSIRNSTASPACGAYRNTPAHTLAIA